MSFETKDSGKREQFASGMQRDTQDNKTLYHLVYDGPLFKRWAELLTRGAKKYNEGNWMKATGEAELRRFKASAARHFFQWYADEIDEDHAAAVVFNINGAEYVKGKRLTDDDVVVDALYEVQEGAGTPDPHARETASRFNGGRPYYDETYTQPVLEIPKPGRYSSKLTEGTYTLLSDDTVLFYDGIRQNPFPSDVFLREYEDGRLTRIPEATVTAYDLNKQPIADVLTVSMNSHIADIIRQRQAEATQDLASWMTAKLFDRPDFSASCSVDPPFNLMQRMLIKLQDFYQTVKSKLAKALYNEAVALDPEVAYDDVESY